MGPSGQPNGPQSDVPPMRGGRPKSCTNNILLKRAARGNQQHGAAAGLLPACFSAANRLPSQRSFKDLSDNPEKVLISAEAAGLRELFKSLVDLSDHTTHAVGRKDVLFRDF